MTSLGTLEVATEYVELTSEIEKRAEEFEGSGIKPFDALHLAAAEAGGAKFICTCDDKLLKKAKTIGNLKVTAISPIELLKEVNL